MRVGIVGSRRRTDRKAVEACISQLAAETVVITGAARGPDRWAEEAARARGLVIVVHKPDLDGALRDGKRLIAIMPATSASSTIRI